LDPLISVIIPCRNYGRFIGDAISSVNKSEQADVEIIVIDNESDDNPEPIVLADEIHPADGRGRIGSQERGLAGEPGTVPRVSRR
jgi:glycosyltransferase involved in cell wall biosynthesis